MVLARARRAQTARVLLAGTGLPATQVAFAAGFGSIRQSNDTMREVCDIAASDLRAMVRPGGAEQGTSAQTAVVRLELALPPTRAFETGSRWSADRLALADLVSLTNTPHRSEVVMRRPSSDRF